MSSHVCSTFANTFCFKLLTLNLSEQRPVSIERGCGHTMHEQVVANPVKRYIYLSFTLIYSTCLSARRDLNYCSRNWIPVCWCKKNIFNENVKINKYLHWPTLHSYCLEQNVKLFLCISSYISSAQHTTKSYGTLYYNAASTQTAGSAVQRSGQPSFSQQW